MVRRAVAPYLHTYMNLNVNLNLTSLYGARGTRAGGGDGAGAGAGAGAGDGGDGGGGVARVTLRAFQLRHLVSLRFPEILPLLTGVPTGIPTNQRPTAADGGDVMMVEAGEGEGEGDGGGDGGGEGEGGGGGEGEGEGSSLARLMLYEWDGIARTNNACDEVILILILVKGHLPY